MYKHQEALLSLNPGERTVEEYDLKFTILSRFVSELVDTEKKRTLNFIRGLREDII